MDDMTTRQKNKNKQKTSAEAVPLHSGHPVQLHVVASTKTFCKGIVLDLQLGYLRQQKMLNY